MHIRDTITTVIPDDPELIVEQDNQQGTLAMPIQSVYQAEPALSEHVTQAQKDSVKEAIFGSTDMIFGMRPDSVMMTKDTVSIIENTPQYYSGNFFKNDSLYHLAIASPRFGIAGDPMPYTQRSDDAVTSVLIIFLLGTILALSHLRHFIKVQVKEFFAPSRVNELRQNETSGERLLQVASVFMTAIMFGLLFFNYVLDNISQTLIYESEYLVMGIFIGETFGVILFKELLSLWINHTFFYEYDLQQWNESKLFLQSLIGVCILPVFLLNVYWSLSAVLTIIIVGLVYFLYQILLFYKAFRIFFAEKVLKLQIFLYLCTIEIFPIALLWALLTLTAAKLTISY